MKRIKAGLVFLKLHVWGLFVSYVKKPSGTPPYRILLDNNTMKTGVYLQAYRVTGTG